MKAPALISLLVVPFAIAAFRHDRHVMVVTAAATFMVVPPPPRSLRRKNNNNNNARPVIGYDIIRSSRTSSTEQDETDIQTVNGPFQPSQLASLWGRKPLLIRNAFGEASLLRSENVWPSLEDICRWSTSKTSGDGELGHDEFDGAYYDDDDDELPVMSRLIRKETERMDSFTLELGPFSDSYLKELLSTTDNKVEKEEGTWTLLLNDVDRIHPPLSEWIHQTFGSFLPGWRLDDGQISIAQKGGGIGPHVDNYDVFLIQTSGRRQWLLGDFISTEQEMDALIDGLEVRILDLEKISLDEGKTEPLQSNRMKVEMNEGDMLYVPPRMVHRGTSQTDDCMTLSVGCRAPSATELVSKVAEHLSYSTAPKAVGRYKDVNLLSKTPSTAADADYGGNTITSQVKEDMKRLVLDAVEDVLDNPLLWDEIVGGIVTEPKRPVETCLSYSNDDIDNNDGADSPKAHVLAALQNGIGALYPTEGVSFATSQFQDEAFMYSRIFADGQMFEVNYSHTGEHQDDADFWWSKAILISIDKRQPLDKHSLEGNKPTPLSSQAVSALEKLVEQGFLYYFDDGGQDE